MYILSFHCGTQPGRKNSIAFAHYLMMTHTPSCSALVLVLIFFLPIAQRLTGVPGRFQRLSWERRIKMGGGNSRKLSRSQASPRGFEMRSEREAYWRWRRNGRQRCKSFEKRERYDRLQTGSRGCKAHPCAEVPRYVQPAILSLLITGHVKMP